MAEKNGWLWCVHTIGPDEVEPAPDFATAWRWCETVNRQVMEYARAAGRADDPSWPQVVSVPALWPWSTERHAEALPAAIENFSPRPATEAQIEILHSAETALSTPDTGRK